MLLNHTMLRVRDPAASLAFYAKHFGMNVIKKMPVDKLGFTNYYLAVDGPQSLYKKANWWQRQGVLELCHNHDAQEKNFVANNGNKEPHRGFGHICFSVNNLEGFCENLEKEGVKFQKRISDGRQKNIAFALDPDGYWVELIENSAGTGIRFNHSMIRVKDKDASIKFYRDILGMKLVDTREHADAKFTLYFFASPSDQPSKGQSDAEGLLELTHNWGTEDEKDFHYHNGNTQPQGYGHVGFIVDDVAAAVEKLRGQGVRVQKDLKDGKMKFIAFVLDPDGYWIELLPNEDAPENVLSE